MCKTAACVVEPAVAVPTGLGHSARVIRQDYLLRLIEQAAQMLARMLGRQAEGQLAESAEISRELAEGWLGLSSDRLRSLSDEELLAHLQRHGAPAEFAVRLGLAISLLKAEGDRCAARGATFEAVGPWATALSLLIRAHILNVAPELPAFTPSLADLLTAMPREELPIPTAVLLMCYYEHTGAFGQAEDLLYTLHELEGSSEQLAELGRQFYQRLQRRTDAELATGNLPRAEVEAGYLDWQAKEAGQRTDHP